MLKVLQLRRLALRSIEFGIAGVLFWSGSEHLKNSFAFLSSVLRYRLVSGQLAVIVATTLPVFQTVLAGAIVLDIDRRRSVICAASLLSFFAIVQLSALIRGLEIGCGCFGASSDAPVSMFSIARVSALAMLGWIAFRAEGDKPKA